jgi:hypothetical protein
MFCRIFHLNTVNFYDTVVFTNWVTSNPFSFRIIKKIKTKKQEENQERKQK